MNSTAAGLGSLPEADLIAGLRSCCGSEAWARAVARRQPFADIAALMAAADQALDGLSDGEWREIITESAVTDVGPGDEPTRAAAAVALQLYAERFGWPFVAVTDNAADELLMRVRIRLGNDEATEWRNTRDEQRRLVRIRLQRLAGAAT